MPNDGDRVTVRALFPMPGVPDGSVSTVSWGPGLAALVDAGRYELLPDPSIPPEPTAPREPAAAPQPDAVAAVTPNAGDGGQEPRPARRARAG